MSAWRFRRCPFCFAVRPAGHFRCVDVGEHWRGQPARRVCPRCGYLAPTDAFRVVRERRRDDVPRSLALQILADHRAEHPDPVQLSFLPEVPYVD